MDAGCWLLVAAFPCAVSSLIRVCLYALQTSTSKLLYNVEFVNASINDACGCIFGKRNFHYCMKRITLSRSVCALVREYDPDEQ